MLCVIFVHVSLTIIDKTTTSATSSQNLRMLSLSSSDAERNNCKSHHFLQIENTFQKLMNIIPVTLRHILPCNCYIVHFEMTKLLLQFTIWHNANIHMSLPSSKLFYGYKKFNMTSLDIVNIVLTQTKGLKILQLIGSLVALSGQVWQIQWKTNGIRKCKYKYHIINIQSIVNFKKSTSKPFLYETFF